MRHHPPRTRQQRIIRYPTRPRQVSKLAALLIGAAALLSLLFMMSY